MKMLPRLIIALFVALAALTFIPAPAATVARAAAYFTPDEIERGAQYAFERRIIYWASVFAQLGFVLWLVFGAGGRRVTAWCERGAGGRWLPTVVLAGAIYYLALTVIDLPFDLARHWHLGTWGMTSQGLGAWLRDYGVTLGVMALFEAVALIGLYVMLRWWPRGWWLPATLGTVALGAFFAWILPIVISPLFNTFTPLRETEWAEWEAPLRRVIGAAQVNIEEIYVIDASRQSHHSNAYFTGFGNTQRIVLYDNLLKKHTLPEIESVLAHELGHWLHDHIVQGIALGGLAAALGLFVLSRILLWLSALPDRHALAPLKLTHPSDPAGLPLLLLLALLGGWVVWPVESAVSRHFERQADQVSLDLGRQPEAFIAAEQKLVRDNVGNPAPAPWNVILFASHPPAVERIEMAQRWRAER